MNLLEGTHFLRIKSQTLERVGAVSLDRPWVVGSRVEVERMERFARETAVAGAEAVSGCEVGGGKPHLDLV